MGQDTHISWTDATANLWWGCTEVHAGCDQAVPNETADRPGGLVREKNPNWKGGRSVASNGYVLVRVGKGHPLADVRGYAYEHRLVASQSLGRQLAANEIVHHRNANKADNSTANLLVVEGNAEHLVHHRIHDHGLRLPGQDNPVISCACGCGRSLSRFDEEGRPRKYVSGHKPPAAPLTGAILEALNSGPLSAPMIASRIDHPLNLVKTTLSRLKRTGEVRHVRRGLWARKDVPTIPVPAGAAS